MFIYLFIYLFVYLFIYSFWYFKNESCIIALAKLTKDRINEKNQYKGCSIFLIKTIKSFKTFKLYENCIVKLYIWLPHLIARCKIKNGNHGNVKGKPLTRQKISIQHNKQLCISLLKVRNTISTIYF